MKRLFKMLLLTFLAFSSASLDAMKRERENHNSPFSHNNSQQQKQHPDAKRQRTAITSPHPAVQQQITDYRQQHQQAYKQRQVTLHTLNQIPTNESMNVEELITPGATHVDAQLHPTANNLNHQQAQNNNHIIFDGLVCVIHDKQSGFSKTHFIPKEIWCYIISFFLGNSLTQDFEHIRINDCRDVANTNKLLKNIIYPLELPKDSLWKNRLFVNTVVTKAFDNKYIKPIQFIHKCRYIESLVNSKTIINAIYNAAKNNDLRFVEKLTQRTYSHKTKLVSCVEIKGAISLASEQNNKIALKELFNAPIIASCIDDSFLESLMLESNREMEEIIKKHLNGHYKPIPCTIQ